jgi:alkaline phosphatase
MRILETTLALALAGSLAASLAHAAGPKKPLAKNVIVMIGDGWGFNHRQAASYYEYGKDSRQIFDRFPFNFAMATYPAYYVNEYCFGRGYDPEAAWSDFDYVKDCQTDSAASATAMSTGLKTYNGAIGVGMGYENLKHAIELAEEMGKATGVVSSVQLSHATPAGFVAHNRNRGNYPQIAQEMIFDSAVDVIMGCGNPWYDDNGRLRSNPTTFRFRHIGGRSTWNALEAGTAGGDADGDGLDDPWTLVQERAEFLALASGPTPARVIGVPQVNTTLQQGRGGDRHADAFVIPLTQTVPTLKEMSAAALNILDEDTDGLFLMIEGGAIDWASHANQSGRMIEEQIDFERAVRAVVDWVEARSNWGETLLIVTGDHETGYLNGPYSNPGWEPLLNNGAGSMPGLVWHSSSHTNSLIPISAKGDAARLLSEYADEFDPVRGPYVDNTELGMLLHRAIEPQRLRPIDE